MILEDENQTLKRSFGNAQSPKYNFPIQHTWDNPAFHCTSD